jgi:hypothetical protein
MPKNANPLTACLLARGSPLLRVFPTLSVLTFFSNQIIYHLSGDQTENFTAQTMDALVGKDFFWRIQEHIRNIQDFCKYREELKKEEEHIPDTETAAKLEMEMKAIDMVRRIDKFMRWATLFRSSFKMARRVVALVNKSGIPVGSTKDLAAALFVMPSFERIFKDWAIRAEKLCSAASERNQESLSFCLSNVAAVAAGHRLIPETDPAVRGYEEVYLGTEEDLRDAALAVFDCLIQASHIPVLARCWQ